MALVYIRRGSSSGSGRSEASNLGSTAGSTEERRRVVEPRGTPIGGSEPALPDTMQMPLVISDAAGGSSSRFINASVKSAEYGISAWTMGAVVMVEAPTSVLAAGGVAGTDRGGDRGAAMVESLQWRSTA